jgi:hypothetical protein
MDLKYLGEKKMIDDAITCYADVIYNEESWKSMFDIRGHP